jgi:hypothetical protein
VERILCGTFAYNITITIQDLIHRPVFYLKLNSTLLSIGLWRWYINITVTILDIQSQSQSYITTDSQSVSKSWCRAQSGTFDQRSFFFLSGQHPSSFLLFKTQLNSVRTSQETHYVSATSPTGLCYL